MAKKPNRSTKPTVLRRQAEELLRTTKRDVATMPVKDVQQLVHELQVHQIELEMQNDELRRTQLELEAVRDRYVDLYDFSPAGHLTLNIHGKVVEANLRAGAILGIDRKKLIGQPLARFIASDDQDIFHRHCQDVMKTGTRQDCEVHLLGGTAGACCVYFESLALHDETGHITQWRTAFLDVSARRVAEAVVSAQRAQLDAIISSAMDAIITVDEGERVVVFNRAAESMFLCQRADAIGQPFDRFIPERFRQAHHDHMSLFALRQSTSRSMGQPGELSGLRANGEEFPVEASISHVLVSGKKLLTVILRDVTERKRVEKDLLESKARLQNILDNSPGMVFLKDLEGRYLHVNRQFESVFHMTREQVVGKTDEVIFSPEQAAVFRANDLKVLQAGFPLEFEEVTMHDDGPHTSIVSKFLLHGGDGKPYALCGITTDITWRKIVEEALHSSEAFTRVILDSLAAHVCVLDKEGIILKTNDAWKEFSSRNTSRAHPIVDVGQSYLDACRRAIAAGDSTAQVILGGIEAVLEGSQTSFTAEYPCHSPEEERWFQMLVTPLKDTKGIVITHTDISSRFRMGLALEKHVLLLSEKQKELESLAEKLIEAQEEERKRIARELHDDFNQRLAALSVELETMERTPLTPPGPLARQLAYVRAQIGQLSDDLHDLAYRLHPSLLEHVGLAAAVGDHIAEFTKRTGLPVTFTSREVPETLSLEVATNLFRVMQESLQNVSKHAQATEVMVRLSGSSKGIGLSVRDNGKGFDHENKNGRTRGLGLVSMAERARGLGGFLRIHSLPRVGTKVCAWIPRFQKGA